MILVVLIYIYVIIKVIIQQHKTSAKTSICPIKFVQLVQPELVLLVLAGDLKSKSRIDARRFQRHGIRAVGPLRLLETHLTVLKQNGTILRIARSADAYRA